MEFHCGEGNTHWLLGLYTPALRLIKPQVPHDSQSLWKDGALAAVQCVCVRAFIYAL